METSAFLQRVRVPGNPQARPESVVVRGNVRFTVLTARMLRLEWSPSGVFTDVATFASPNRRMERPALGRRRASADRDWLADTHLSPAQRRVYGR
jgi:hypothetical protein